MNQDNTRFGFYCSLALHICAALAIVASMFVSVLFPPPEEKDISPFEMVEPQPETPPAPSEPFPVPPQIDAPEVKEIKPLDLPPEPENSPEPELQPEPKPDPAPAPALRGKKVEKAKPEPKKVSYKDFIKKNPRKSQPTRKTTQGKPVVAPKITANTSNIENIANISTRGMTSYAMKDALAAYAAYIKSKAYRNWVVPDTAAQGMVARIELRVGANGMVSGVRISESSGDAAFDNSVLAIFRAITLDPPPDKEAHTVTIKFTI